MATGGQAGSYPAEYRLIRAARYLGVAPWELAAQCDAWVNWAICFEQAEFKAERIAEKIAKHRRGEKLEDEDDDDE